MGLTVTAGSASADAMVSLADFKAYCDERGFDYSAFTDPEIEIAIRQGADYLSRTYGLLWKGIRASRTQSMPFPRCAVVDQDGFEVDDGTIPQAVEYANCEAGILKLQGVDLLPRLERGGAVKRERFKAGSAEIETEYDGAPPAHDRITAIDGLLTGLVKAVPGGGFAVARAVRG